MFRLTIQRGSIETSFTCDKARLLAGSMAELQLTGPRIIPNHFAIYSKQGAYYIENIASDPKLRLNGNPFWKSRLRDNDLIEVDENRIVFNLLTTPTEESSSRPKKALHTVDEVQQFSLAPIPPAPPITQERRASKFFKELGTHLIEKLNTEKRDSSWHVFGLFFGFGTALLSLFCLIFYITVSQKSEHQRLIAARGLSDIAVTLSYAKMHRLKPSNLNWIDPDFLIETSKHVIPDSLTSRNWIQEGGEFTETPYLLRIYSDPQLDRFLLIAQPRANFVQWLIPNSAVAVDSASMIMREIPHIKDLNRLLVNSNGFQGSSQQEVLKLIENQTPITLKKLAQNRQDKGFMPPQELSMIGEELELYLYNAPRYYLWNQTLVDKANQLLPKDKEEAELIANSLKRRLPYKEMVLYTHKGIETAINARRTIAELGIDHPFHIGYLTITKNGQIDSSHVLVKNSKPWAFENKYRLDEKPLLHLPSEIAELTKNPLTPFTQAKKSAKTKGEKAPLHPLLIELSLLVEERESLIKPHLEPLIALLTEHTSHSDRQFFIRYKALFANYEKALRESQEKLDQSVDRLHEKYVIQNQSVTLPQFLALLEQKGIDIGYEEDNSLVAKVNTDEQIKTLFTLIEETKNIHVLDQAVREAHDLITQEKVKEQLRSLVLHKLEGMLWKPTMAEGDLPGEDEMRWIVGRILKNGYITQGDAKAFYLSNFLE